MKSLCIVLIYFFLIQTCTNAQDLYDNFMKIVTGAEVFISTTLFSNCQDLKSFFGITYDQFVATNRTPNVERVVIHLKTSDNSIKFNFSTAATNILASPYFNKSLPLVFYIHGFQTTNESLDVITMPQSFFIRGGYNVLYLDASALIYNFYMYATTCVEFIGIRFGEMLASLTSAGNIDPQTIHLVGFSLGAHISGFAGKTFSSITGLKLGRITGLDPAGRCYFNNGAQDRLSSGDANFVDVIHTDAGVWGIIRPIGDVDFYVNGGNSQPQRVSIYESHIRAWKYFNETIGRGYEKDFAAVRCPNWYMFRTAQCIGNFKTYMGLEVPSNVNGIFFLRTADTSVFPFGLKEDSAVPITCPLWLFIAWFLSLFGIYI